MSFLGLFVLFVIALFIYKLASFIANILYCTMKETSGILSDMDLEQGKPKVYWAVLYVKFASKNLKEITMNHLLKIFKKND